MNFCGECFNFFDTHVKFCGQGHARRIAHDQMGLHIGVLQNLQQANAIHDAGCTTDADDQSSLWRSAGVVAHDVLNVNCVLKLNFIRPEFGFGFDIIALMLEADLAIF